MTVPAKIQCLLPVFLLLSGIFFQPVRVSAQTEYILYARSSDMPPGFYTNEANLQTKFPNRTACENYVTRLTTELYNRGFVSASVDSASFDTASANIVVFFGRQYKWSHLDVAGIDENILRQAGWNENMFEGKAMDFQRMVALQNNMLNYLENNGYPFAKSSLDSILFRDDSIIAKLNLDPGPLYHIDSIRIYGEVKVSNLFLQRFLDIPNGSIYNKKKLVAISGKIRELGYVEEERPSDRFCSERLSETQAKQPGQCPYRIFAK